MAIGARKPLLLLIAALAVATAVPADAGAARYASRTLERGSHGGDVKRLQRFLGKAGHRTGADGEFGPRTQRALKATERELELRSDGVATRREQRAIRRAVASPGTGGVAYAAPPPVSQVVRGGTGKVDSEGFAIPPASAPRVVKAVVAAGNKIAKTPYKWGGGHGRWNDTGYDCSGSVSYALHAAGLLDSPLVSGDLATWGVRGRGGWITIYANSGHVYMVVAHMRFDTSARSRTGSRWTRQHRSSDGYAVRHPSGL
jgi:cell wall-associated NlpC family hydrolase